MYKIRQIGLVAAANFRRWRRNSQIVLAFALGFVVCFLLSDKVLVFAKEHDTIVQVLEPFIWTFGDANSILVISLRFCFYLQICRIWEMKSHYF